MVRLGLSLDLRTGLVAVAALATSTWFGCGGGSAGSSPGGSSSSSTQHQSAVFTIRIPAKAQAAARALQYVSPSTQSLAIIAIYGDATPVFPAIVDVVPNSSACVLQNDGSQLCTVSVEVIRGATGLDITAFDQPQGRGHILAHARVAVPQTTADSVNVTLGGVVARFTMSLSGGAFLPGASGTKIVTVSAFDYDGNLIVAPGDYDSPILLFSSEPAVTLFPNVVTNPAQVVTAIYDGTLTSNASITGYLSSNTQVAQAIRAVGSLPPPTPAPFPSGTPNPIATAIVVVK